MFYLVWMSGGLMKTRLQQFAVLLSILSGAILATIYLAWLFYPVEINVLNLEGIVYMKAADISYNFNVLLNYLTNPLVQVLEMPNFSSSADGLHHFEQVKWLFHLTQAIFVLTIPILVLFFKQVIQKGYGPLVQKGFVWAAVLPMLIGLFGLLIGFDAFFVLFHQVLFVGDSTWLFNPATDPVIYILPQEFFLHCFVLFFLIYEVLCLSFVWLTRKK